MGGSWCGFILSISPLMALLSPGNSILAGWCRTFPAGVLGPGERGSPLGTSPQPVTSRCFITTELSQSRRVAQNVRGGERPRGHRKFGNFSWVTEWAATLQHVVCHCAWLSGGPRTRAWNREEWWKNDSRPTGAPERKNPRSWSRAGPSLAGGVVGSRDCRPGGGLSPPKDRR